MSNRIYSGLRKNQLMGKHQLFVHLTTWDYPNRDLNDSFEVLKKRLIRKYGQFTYCKIKTNEGNGVLHIAIAGLPYISQRWLSNQWKEIHGAPVVWISEINNAWSTASYMVTHYMESQKCTYTRYSSSSDWLQRGYAQVYMFIKNRFRRWKEAYRFNDDGNWCYPVEWPLVNYYWSFYINIIATDHPPTSAQAKGIIAKRQEWLERPENNHVLETIRNHRGRSSW